jgi:hypothetical protein
MTGEISEIFTWQEENGYTIIPVHFEPEGSQFIIFRECGKNKPHITQIYKDGRSFFPGNVYETKSTPFIEIEHNAGKIKARIAEPGVYELTWLNGKKSTVKVEEGINEMPIEGSWELSFDLEWGGSEKLIVDELKSWTEFRDEGIKYYSGTAVYKNEFEFSLANLKGNHATLDLGNLHELATIVLNGKTLSTVWCFPYLADVTNELKEGTNTLEIKVVNLWPNRLILDGILPVNKRLTKTNVNKFEAEDAEKYLRQSGLIGPVKLKMVSVTNIQ